MLLVNMHYCIEQLFKRHYKVIQCDFVHSSFLGVHVTNFLRVSLDLELDNMLLLWSAHGILLFIGFWCHLYSPFVFYLEPWNVQESFANQWPPFVISRSEF